MRTGRRAAPAHNTAALLAWDHTASSPQPHGHAGWLRKHLPALGKQQSPQVYCWRAKPSSLVSTCVPTVGPLRAWGLKLPQRSRLPEQEAGDQAEGQGRGLSQAHPALESLSPAVLVGVGDPVQGCRPTSCSPRKPRAGSYLIRGPTCPSLAPLRSEQRCVCLYRRRQAESGSLLNTVRTVSETNAGQGAVRVPLGGLTHLRSPDFCQDEELVTRVETARR